MQATQIGAAREEWQRKLTTQQEQFAMGQALQQEQIFRQQQASEFATMKQAQVQRAQVTAQQEQFEQNLAMQQQRMVADKAAREQAFELQQAQEARLLQSAQAATQATQMRSAFDFKKLKVAEGVTTGNLEDWKKMQGTVSPEEYTAGMIAISQGKVPRISVESDALIQEKRALDIEKKRIAMEGGLSDRERTVAQEAFSDTFGKAAGAIGGFIGGLSKEELKSNYLGYRVRTGYENRNPAERKELDALFDVNIKTYEKAGYFGYYSEWNPDDTDIKQLRSPTKSRGVIGDVKANEYILRAKTENPGKSEAEIKTIAINTAISEGWEL